MFESLSFTKESWIGLGIYHTSTGPQGVRRAKVEAIDQIVLDVNK